MARETEKRRAELRERLIDIAESEVREHGMEALRARTLADQAGCAVGAIYNVFTDMNGLILAVNVRSFVRLDKRIKASVEGRETDPPLDRMMAMAEAYVNFAAEEKNLWRAVFDIEMTADSDVPDWYMEELGKLFSVIGRPLAELDPEAPREELELRTRALFAATHGIVRFSLERRMSGIPRDKLLPMIRFFLKNAANSVG